MSVAKKKKRKIVIGDRNYYWYIAEDYDDFPSDVMNNTLHALNIVSEDKKFIVRYYLGFKTDEKRHLTIIGVEFNGLASNGKWRRVKCPDWVAKNQVTPKDVRRIIEWCNEEKMEIIPVDHNGNEL